MKLTRGAPWLHLFIWCALCIGSGGIGTLAGLVPARLHAAPARQTHYATPAALSFRVTARFVSKASGNAPAAAQTVDAKVLVQGQRLRIESTVGDRRLVILWVPPHLYRLLPDTVPPAGVRYRIPDQGKQQGGDGSGGKARGAALSGLPGSLQDLDPQALLGDPAAIRAALQKRGARRTGAGRLGGVAVDIFEASRINGPAQGQAQGQVQPAQSARLWLRRSDALPVKLEWNSAEGTVTASWRDYRRLASLPATLFTVPKNYRIRDGVGQPRLL